MPLNRGVQWCRSSRPVVLKEAAREEASYLREVLFAPISIRGAGAVDTCLWANPIIGRATARRDKARRSPCSEKKPAAKNSVDLIRFERFSYDVSFVCLCDNSLNLSLAAACNIAFCIRCNAQCDNLLFDRAERVPCPGNGASFKSVLVFPVLFPE